MAEVPRHQVVLRRREHQSEHDFRVTAESTEYRCQAVFNTELQLLPCFDVCEAYAPDEIPDLNSAWKEVPIERELIKMCGPLVGPWMAAGRRYPYAGACVANSEVVTDLDASEVPGAWDGELPSALCECTAAACEALAGPGGASGQ